MQTIKEDPYYDGPITAIREHLKELRQVARNKTQTDAHRLLSAAELLANGQWLTEKELSDLFVWLLQTMHNLIKKHDVEGKINSPIYDKRATTQKIQQSKFKYYDTLVLQDLCEDIGLKVTTTRESLEGVLTEYLTSVGKSITDVIKERRTKVQIEQENLAKLEEMKRKNPETLQKYYLRKKKQEALAKQNQQPNNNNNQQTEPVSEETDDEQFNVTEIEQQKQVSLFSEEYEKIITRNMPPKPYAQEQKLQQQQKKQWISASQKTQVQNQAPAPSRKPTLKRSEDREKEIDEILSKKQQMDEKALWEQADEDVYYSTDEDSSDSDDEDEFSPSEMECESDDSNDSDYQSNDSMNSDSEEQEALEEEKLMAQQTYAEVECYEQSWRGWTRYSAEMFQCCLIVMLHFVLGAQRKQVLEGMTIPRLKSHEDGSVWIKPVIEKVPRPQTKDGIFVPTYAARLIHFFVENCRPLLLPKPGVISIWISKKGTPLQGGAYNKRIQWVIDECFNKPKKQNKIQDLERNQQQQQQQTANNNENPPPKKKITPQIFRRLIPSMIFALDIHSDGKSVKDFIADYARYVGTSEKIMWSYYIRSLANQKSKHINEVIHSMFLSEESLQLIHQVQKDCGFSENQIVTILQTAQQKNDEIKALKSQLKAKQEELEEASNEYGQSAYAAHIRFLELKEKCKQLEQEVAMLKNVRNSVSVVVPFINQ